MTAMMKAHMISNPKYPTVSLWMFSVVVTFLGVFNSLFVSSVMDDFEFPIQCVVGVLFLFLWVSCGS